MNNCSGCKWWEQEGGQSWGWCDLTTVRRAIPDHKGSKATAHDSEGQYAALKTQPDFGCVQWEAKGEHK